MNNNLAVVAENVVNDPTKFVWFDMGEVISDDMAKVPWGKLPFAKCAITYPMGEGGYVIGLMGLTDDAEDDYRILATFRILSMVDGRRSIVEFNFKCKFDIGTIGKLTYATIPEEQLPAAKGVIRLIPSDDEVEALLSTLHDFNARLARGTTDACIASVGKHNKKRISKGKKPMYDWKTVVVEPKPVSLPSGNHTGVKQRYHPRRGCWCHVKKTGTRYWRNSCWAGDKSLGTIFHDYVVK